MGQFRVKEIERDQNLAIIKKEISIDNSFSFLSPSKATKPLKVDSFVEGNSSIHEIVKRIDEPLLDALETGASSRIAREIKTGYRRGKLNLVIFNLTFDRIPDKNRLKHSCSTFVCLERFNCVFASCALCLIQRK